MKAQSAGGKVTAIILRSRALELYYKNPNYCIYCNSIIEVKDNMKVHDAKIKKFCNKSCAAKFNNSKFPKRIKNIKNTKSSISKKEISTKTKGELFSNRKNWQSARSAIQKNARIVYNNSEKPKCCSKCNYDKHYEIAHIKSVSDFNDNTLISEINNINNLIALCPNCHWEFDNLEAEKGIESLNDKQ